MNTTNKTNHPQTRRGNTKMKKNTKTEGFGYCPEDSGHHFVVYIPRSAKESVLISEHLSGDDSWKSDQIEYSMGKDSSSLRVILSADKWERIGQAVATELNRRLKKDGLKTSAWKPGVNSVSRNLGKELVLLCWAIEDTDASLIPTALQNWLGLSQEERWWLYTMTNAATGHAVNGKGKGWRKAVRYALTENPVSEKPHVEQLNFLEMFIETAEKQAANPKR